MDKQKEQDDNYQRRQYKRKSQIIKCGKCQMDRTGPGHYLYFGNIYCEKVDSDTVSLDVWKSVMHKKYKKKKNNPPTPPPAE